MTLRDKIMDKYWLEFLTDNRLDTSQYMGRIDNMQFWDWFKETKLNKNPTVKLEDYL